MTARLETVIPLLRGLRIVEGPTEAVVVGANAPVTAEFVGDIRIVYVFDEGALYRWATRGELEALGITLDELDRRAYSNLLAKCRQLQLRVDASPTGLTSLVMIGEDLEASLLMNGHIWNHLAEQMPGPLVAVCPAKDVLAVGCLAVHGSLKELREGARRVIAGGGAVVSTQTLEWMGDGWSVYER